MANSRLTGARYQLRMPAGTTNRTLWWSAVAAVTLLGLALRIAAAQGALWTDEAWSMVYAAQARDAAGVFLRINHDNNHHLNSLWLLAVGIGAPPWLARLPAILAGTASIVAAALLTGSRSRASGIAAAALFAVSPAMVTFGSEARGYALMLLAALVMLLIVTRAVERHASERSTPWWLALIATLGMLSHLTMAAPVGLMTTWIYFERRDHLGSKEALHVTVRLIGPAVVATAGVVAFVFAAALASPNGFRVGGYLPFTLAAYTAALDQVSGAAIGLSILPFWSRLAVIAIAALWVALRPPNWLGSRGRLYGLLILGVPLAILLLRPGNAGFGRYYLTSLIGLLLLIGEAAGWACAREGIARAATLLLGLLLLGLNLTGDARLMAFDRGRPDGPLADMAKLAPVGTHLAVYPQFEAVVTLAARRAHYPLQLAHGCGASDFLLAPRPAGPLPVGTVHCGTKMRLLDSSTVSPLTGDAWVLYVAETLQTRRPPVSGRAPGASKERLPGRAGVAQG